MAGKSWKLVVAAVFLLVLLAIMRWAHGDSTYEAKCVYAYWESNITTNLAGDVAQLKDAIERKRRKGEGVSDLVAKLKKAEVAVQEYRPRITVIKPPFIIPLYTKGIINE